MAVPKKKMSRSKRDSRKSNWKNKVILKVSSALSLAKSVLYGKGGNFVSN